MIKFLEWTILWCPCLRQESDDNTRQSETEISHDIFLDLSMNVDAIDEVEVVSPMYEGKCKSSSFRLSYEQSDYEENALFELNINETK